MAYSTEESHTGQLDFCNRLADGSTTINVISIKLRQVYGNNVDFLNQILYFSIK